MEKNKVVDFYNNFLSVLKKDGDAGNARHQHIKQRFAEFFTMGEEVLDLGCGLGLTTSFLKELGTKPTGVDISPALIKEAKKKYGKNFLCHDVLDLDLGKKYDAITLIDCLEHFPKGEFKKIYKVIDKHSKEKTKVFINIPFGGYQQYLKKYRPDLLQIIDEAVPTEEIISEMKKIGFELAFFNNYGPWSIKNFHYVEFLFVKFGKNYEEELWGQRRKQN